MRVGIIIPVLNYLRNLTVKNGIFGMVTPSKASNDWTTVTGSAMTQTFAMISAEN